MGRRCKLTPETQDTIVEAIRRGNFASVAARLAGISEATFYRWMEQGEKQRSGKFREFREAIKQAEAQAEDKMVGAITEAAENGSWFAAVNYLERKHPDRWRRRKEVPEPINPPEEPNTEGLIDGLVSAFERKEAAPDGPAES